MSWPVIALGDVVTLRTGPFGSALHQADYEAGGIPLINPTHIQNGRLLPDEAVAVGPKKSAELRDFALEVGDVVMGRRGEMGRCGVVTEAERGWLCGTGSIIVRPTREITSDFLQRFLASPGTVRALEADSVGTTMVNLNQKILLSLKVPLPSVDQQFRIAAILDKADALRAKRREAIAKLDQLLQSVFLDMFGASKGHPVVPLADAFWFQEGPGVRKWQFRDTGVKLLNVGNIEKDGSINLLKTDRHISNEEAKGKYEHFLVDEGDLVIASSGISFDDDGMLRTRGGFISKQHLPLCMNTSTIRFKAIAGKSTLRYLQVWIGGDGFRAQITKLVTGSAQQNFGPSHLRQLVISLPPIGEQEAFAKRAAAINAMKDRLLSSASRLDATFASLQQAAFSGAL